MEITKEIINSIYYQIRGSYDETFDKVLEYMKDAAIEKLENKISNFNDPNNFNRGLEYTNVVDLTKYNGQFVEFILRGVRTQGEVLIVGESIYILQNEIDTGTKNILGYKFCLYVGKNGRYVYDPYEFQIINIKYK